MGETGKETASDEGNKIISIELDYDRTVNYAMQQNDVPVVKGLRIVNGSENVLRNLLVRITTEPAFAASWETRVAALNPGETFNLVVVDLPLFHDFLPAKREIY